MNPTILMPFAGTIPAARAVSSPMKSNKLLPPVVVKMVTPSPIRQTLTGGVIYRKRNTWK